MARRRLAVNTSKWLIAVVSDDKLSSASAYSEELERIIGLLTLNQDVRRCHYAGEQRRDADRRVEEAFTLNEDDHHEFLLLSLDSTERR